MCKYFPNIFFSISPSKIFAAVYLRVCSTGPLTFSHPSASLLELQLNRAIKNVCLLWMINSDQIYARKWNWRNVVSKYSIWNNSYLPKMGGEVVILANSLISHFQWGLRHSALRPPLTFSDRDFDHICLFRVWGLFLNQKQVFTSDHFSNFQNPYWPPCPKVQCGIFLSVKSTSFTT